MFAIWFESERILLWLRQDPEVARLAAVYLHWVSLGLPGMFRFRGCYVEPHQYASIRF
jgi:Na+-driven multidrug efflux pump